MARNEAAAGAARERYVAQQMESYGWRKIMRASSSKGSADLLMAHPEHGAALVQVGKDTKTLGPADRTRFLTDAAWVGALPIVATVDRGRITYRYATLATASYWEDWTP